MAILKCKMCGGDLEIAENISVCECEYCGTKQTVPNADNEKKMTLFSRANRLRLSCEFDKASGVYESIVSEFPEEAEGYWGLVLCAYGIEYVDDPLTGKKIPTCHRSSFDSIMDNADFEQALENADSVARGVYREEAKVIEEIRKGIIDVSSKEEPYDIFICYKETAENGDRTIDSVIAQDVYDALCEKGYRVFFSRITLEDKLGTEYEPYIFAALNSAKIMLAFGTDYEYYNAVWVKNEWSRFLQLIAKGEKKTLIPCYKDIDAYDMPKEFAKLQAQDMGKVGAIQDLLHGIEKIIPKTVETRTETVIVNQSANETEPLLKRMFMFLEDGNFKSADEYAEKVLDINPECAEAYLGKLMASYRVMRKTELANLEEPFDENVNYDKAIRFADDSLKDLLNGYILTINTRIDQLKIEETYEAAKQLIEYDDIESYKMAIENLNSVLDYKDAKELKEFCIVKIEELKENSEKKKPLLEEKRNQINTIKGMLAVGNNCIIGMKVNASPMLVRYKEKNLNDSYDYSKDYGQFKFDFWGDIIAIAAGYRHTVGLKSDGTVVATGDTKSGQCDVSNWTDIVGISASTFHTVGLKSDGTVVATVYRGDERFYHGQCDISDWTDIIAVSAGLSHTAGLKKDGTVVVAGENKLGLGNVSEWKNIVAVAAGDGYTVGLKADGTVVATGDGSYGRCNVDGWNDIVAISASGHTVGLKLDGTVVTAGDNTFGRCDVSDWTDVVSIYTHSFYTVGLKSDGTVLVAGNTKYSDSNISEWKLFNSIHTIEEERHEAQSRKKQKELNSLRRTQNLCQHCGGQFKGFFAKKCVSCGKEKDY